ncbi:MAG: APC family permease [Actinomycetota bacterium]
MHSEQHHRPPKRSALAVFSSNPLSSSAYATDEILLILLAGGTAAAAFSVPVALSVLLVMAAVIFSYRLTIRAYPDGGGAYLAALDHLGAPPGLMAASALVINYVLTVAVSISAAVAAMSAAVPEVRDYKLALALAGVGLIAALNLRGLRESGTLFAIPTYGFVLAMGTMIVVGLIRASTGELTPNPAFEPELVQPVTAFLLLRAFAAGSTALSGIETISSRLRTFRPPESRNAAQTLLIIGVILGSLFLGITFLARAVNVNPALIGEGATVTSQVARGVFGGNHPMYYLVQTLIAAILVLAAGTAYADFPRLASILAKDRYLPRSLSRHGTRRTSTHSVTILTAAAAGLLIGYGADLHRLIPLYVLGVFTTFTLSQAGVVSMTLNERRKAIGLAKTPDPAWRLKVIIGSFGAIATFVALMVVGSTEFLVPPASGRNGGFRGGTWQVMVLIPTLAWLMWKMHLHYLSVEKKLEFTGDIPQMRSEKVVLVLSRFRGATKALAFARTIAPTELRAVAFRCSEQGLADLNNRWASMGVRTPIEPVGNEIKDVIKFVDSMGPTSREPVTLIFPDPHYTTWLGHFLNNRNSLKLKKAFLFKSGTVLVSIPYEATREPEPRRLQAPGRLALVVAVSAVNQSTVRAVRYAESLNPAELKAISIQVEPGAAERLTDEWGRSGLTVPLEIVDSPFGDLVEPLKRELRALGPNTNDAIGVVVPEFVVPHWWQALLHTQTAFFIKAALLFEPEIIVINVPLRVHPPKQKTKRLPESSQSTKP